MAEAVNSWTLIQQGVSETERLIGQKQFNLAMVKARQTLEYMVKNLAKRNGVREGDLMDMIDELYRNGVITKTTCEHYHKIRMLGNKALHDEDNNAYNASNAYHLLSQEVYIFANDYSSNRRRAAAEGRPRAKSRSGQESPAFFLLKILVPVLVIILVIAIVRMVHPGKKSASSPVQTAKTTTVATSTVVTAASTLTPQTTVPPTTAAPVYKATASLNVRSAPGSEGKVLTTVPAGTVLNYIGSYNNDWAIINYNGGQAYVSTKYIAAEAAGGTQSSSAASAGASSAAKSAAAKTTVKAASTTKAR
jgi:uncharacterized protein YgiM (DUF1202 family)